MSLTTSPTVLVSQNLATVEARISREQEKTLAWLAELGETDGARIATRNGCAEPILRDLYWEEGKPTPHPTHLSEHRAPLSLSLACGREALLPAYINALLSACRREGAELTLSDFLYLTSKKTARIAYMKNPYADEAYEALSPALSSTTVSYTDSYRAACEDVATGDADFCILPYENAGGEISTTEALAERYALCRVQSCRVFHADGTDVTHFALYGKDFLPIDEGAACTLLYRFPYDKEELLARHFAALGAFSVNAAHFCARRNEDEDSPMRAHVTARIPKKALIPFLTYLTVFVRDSVICGLYKENES